MNTHDLVELTDAELDAVTGGAQGNGLGNAFGLVAAAIGAGVAIDDLRLLNNNTVNVLSNGVDVGVVVPIGIAASILGFSANALRGQLAQ
jgi:hypothetical protein